MYKYPTWKYILVLIVLTYAVIYSLPNFYNTYPSINVTTFENKEIISEELLTLSNKHNLSSIGLDGNSIFFDSIDNQLKAYNKLSQEKLYQYTLSNYNQIPRWLSAINANPVSLGLDLKGGVHFLLQIDTENVKKSRINQLENNLRNFFIENSIGYSSFVTQDGKVTFNLTNKKIDPEIMTALEDNFSDYEITTSNSNDGLDIVANLSQESLDNDIKASMKRILLF